MKPLWRILDGQVLLFSTFILPFSFPLYPGTRKHLFFTLGVFSWFVVLYVLKYTLSDLLLSAYGAAALSWPLINRTDRKRIGTAQIPEKKKMMRKKRD